MRAVAALQGYLPPHARVIRDGAHLTVDAVTVVPGDLLVVSEGDRICADARLIDGAVELDLSALTGESVPVTRNATDTDPRRDWSKHGTRCSPVRPARGGQARAIVFATGAATELGRIAVLSQHDVTGESPLERQVRHVAWLIAGVAVAIGLRSFRSGCSRACPCRTQPCSPSACSSPTSPKACCRRSPWRWPSVSGCWRGPVPWSSGSPPWRRWVPRPSSAPTRPAR